MATRVRQDGKTVRQEGGGTTAGVEGAGGSKTSRQDGKEEGNRAGNNRASAETTAGVEGIGRNR